MNVKRPKLMEESSQTKVGLMSLHIYKALESLGSGYLGNISFICSGQCSPFQTKHACTYQDSTLTCT